jgi:hypothetical protein
MNKEIKIRKSLKNIPLSIFYSLILIILVLFFQFAEIPILTIISSLILTYYIVRSIFGEATVTLTKDRIYLYSGLFSFGSTRSISLQNLKSIYVKKKSKGGAGEYGRTADEVRQSIIFNCEKKVKFLTNRIGLDDLLEYRNRIVNEIMKWYDVNSIPSWQENQHEYFHEYSE